MKTMLKKVRIAIALGCPLLAVAWLAPSQTGVVLSRSEAAAIVGGSTCAGRSENECVPGEICKDTLLWTNDPDGNRVWGAGGAGGCGSNQTGTACGTVGFKEQGPGCSQS